MRRRRLSRSCLRSTCRGSSTRREGCCQCRCRGSECCKTAAWRRPWREYDAQLGVGRRRVGGGVGNPGMAIWGQPGVRVCGKGRRGWGHVAQLDVHERRVRGGVFDPGAVVGFLLTSGLLGVCSAPGQHFEGEGGVRDKFVARMFFSGSCIRSARASSGEFILYFIFRIL